MKLHRFYMPSTDPKEHFWLKGDPILHQWLKVLRFKPGQEVVLFNGWGQDHIYKIVSIEAGAAELIRITDLIPKMPKNDIYLFWSLLKKDKNDWILQKGTELGVTHFVALKADRSEKTNFNRERAKKIVVEAAEQCGRSDIPRVRRDVLGVRAAIEQYYDKITLYVCEQGSQDELMKDESRGVLIGPEGGWSDAEKQLFTESKLKQLHLHDFTLRAETAAVASILKVIQ